MEIEFTPKQVRNYAESIRGLSTKYKNNYEKIYSAMEALKAKWGGADFDAFNSKVNGFRDDFDSMKDLMNQYALFLEEAATRYEEAQRANLNKASEIKTNSGLLK